MHSVIEDLVNHIHQTGLLFTQACSPAEITRQSLSLAIRLIKSGRTLPDSLLAITSLPQASSAHNLLPQRAACLMTFLGLKFQLNDHYLQHLVAATFAVCSLKNNAEQQEGCQLFWREKRLLFFSGLLKLQKVAQAPAPHRFLHPHRLNEEQSLFISVISLIKNQQGSMVSRLKPVIPRTNEREQHRFECLLKYPGEFMPGCAVSFPKGEGVFLFTLTSTTGAVLTGSGDVEEKHLRQIKITRYQALSLNEWLSEVKACDAAFRPAVRQLIPDTYPVSRLPGNLQTIITSLHDTNTDIHKLSRRLSRMPVFSDYLKKTASLDNRLQLPVKDVKQAIMTYGLTRVGDMLIMRALNQRLHQRHFPQLAVCIRFAELVAAIASELAERSNVKQTPQTAALIATFITAPLFTLHALKVIKHWPLHRQRLYQLTALQETETQPLPALSASLAKQWQQPARYQAVITHCSTLPAHVPEAVRADAALAGLSILLANKWLFGGAECENTKLFKSQALQSLKLTPSSLSEIAGVTSYLMWLPLRQRS